MQSIGRGRGKMVSIPVGGHGKPPLQPIPIPVRGRGKPPLHEQISIPVGGRGKPLGPCPPLPTMQCNAGGLKKI